MSDQNVSAGQCSGIGQTATIGRPTSVAGSAAKVFREFKWGLLALFLLMAVVIALVYDGGRRKKNTVAEAPKGDERIPPTALESGPETGAPPVVTAPGPIADTGSLTAGGQPPVKTGAPIIENYQPPAPLPPSPKPEVAKPVDPPKPKDIGQKDTATVAKAGPVTTPKPTGTEQTYTVAAGDTLTGISNKFLPGKSGVKAIQDANKDVLPNPNKLRPGMVLKIPAAAPTASDTKTAKTETSAKKTETAVAQAKTSTSAEPASEYTVQSGDSLERIARKLFNDVRKWREIYEWNRDQLADPAHLRSGQVLKIKHVSAKAASNLPSPSAPRAEAETPATPHAVDNKPPTQVMSATSASLP